MSATSDRVTADSRRTPAEVLKESRTRTSREKRGRVSLTVQKMLRDGEPITFAEVARTAQVSSWLVYAEGPREEINQAIQSQMRQTARGDKEGTHVSNNSLRTDLELARSEIKSLRAERDQMRRQIQAALGQQLVQLTNQPLVERIEALTEELRLSNAANSQLRHQISELEDELAGARTALRRMIKEGAREDHEPPTVDSQIRE